MITSFPLRALIRTLTYGLLFAFQASTASAEIFTVTSTANSGPGSLRQAIADANGSPTEDTIVFASNLSGQTITLIREIFINNAGRLTIDGLGANNLTVSGDGVTRIFYVNGATVTISGLRLTNGNGFGNGIWTVGGAMYVDGGALTLDRVFITGNTAPLAGGIFIWTGNHRIINSTISDNEALEGDCGGLSASTNLTTLTVVNSTISGNIARNFGGGLCTSGNITLRNVTVTANQAFAGAAWKHVDGIVNFANTIISGNTATGNSRETEIYNLSTLTSAGNNLVGTHPGDSDGTNVPVVYQPSDIRDVNPLLNLLQNNGGQTPTHAIRPGSPAIDAGSNAAAVDPSRGNASLTTDQRGFARIASGSLMPLVVDIGAFEFDAAPPSVSVTVAGRVLTPGQRGIAIAFVTITNSNGMTRTTISNFFGYYRFTGVQTGQTYTFYVSAKRYSFSPQTVTVNGELTNLNFVAQP